MSERGLRDGAGFTLVEALAAFVILAMLSLAIQRGLVQSRLGWRWMDERSAATRLAGSLLEQPVDLARAEAGGWEGTADGHRFRVRLSPAALPLPEPPEASGPGAAPPGDDAAIRWVPMRQRIQVEAVRGAISVETIRLCPFRTHGPLQAPRG